MCFTMSIFLCGIGVLSAFCVSVNRSRRERMIISYFVKELLMKLFPWKRSLPLVRIGTTFDRFFFKCFRFRSGKVFWRLTRVIRCALSVSTIALYKIGNGVLCVMGVSRVPMDSRACQNIIVRSSVIVRIHFNVYVLTRFLRFPMLL